MIEDEFNHVQWPSDEELEREQREDDETFSRMPAGEIQKNVERAIAKFRYLSDEGLTADWPDVDSWHQNPQAVLNDFIKFGKIYKKLVNYDPAIGHYFADESPAQLAWAFYSRTFPEAIQAIIPIMPLPLSVPRLQRLRDIVSAYRTGNEVESPTFDEHGNPNGRRCTWNPLSFREQQKLCEEGLQIIQSETEALRRFVPLKTRVRSDAADASQKAGGNGKSTTAADTPADSLELLKQLCFAHPEWAVVGILAEFRRQRKAIGKSGINQAKGLALIQKIKKGEI
jgi:hypothetical protein